VHELLKLVHATGDDEGAHFVSASPNATTAAANLTCSLAAELEELLFALTIGELHVAGHLFRLPVLVVVIEVEFGEHGQEDNVFLALCLENARDDRRLLIYQRGRAGIRVCVYGPLPFSQIFLALVAALYLEVAPVEDY